MRRHQLATSTPAALEAEQAWSKSPVLFCMVVSEAERVGDETANREESEPRLSGQGLTCSTAVYKGASPNTSVKVSLVSLKI